MNLPFVWRQHRAPSRSSARYSRRLIFVYRTSLVCLCLFHGHESLWHAKRVSIVKVSFNVNPLLLLSMRVDNLRGSSQSAVNHRPCIFSAGVFLEHVWWSVQQTKLGEKETTRQAELPCHRHRWHSYSRGHHNRSSLRIHGEGCRKKCTTFEEQTNDWRASGEVIVTSPRMTHMWCIVNSGSTTVPSHFISIDRNEDFLIERERVHSVDRFFRWGTFFLVKLL